MLRLISANCFSDATKRIVRGLGFRVRRAARDAACQIAARCSSTLKLLGLGTKDYIMIKNHLARNHLRFLSYDATKANGVFRVSCNANEPTVYAALRFGVRVSGFRAFAGRAEAEPLAAI